MIGAGPIIGGGIGYSVGKAFDSPIAGTAAGIGAGYAARSMTLANVARGAWTASNFVRFGTATASIGAGTAAATVGAGLAAGVIAGTAVVKLAEETGLVQEGSTGDVLEFYSEPLKAPGRLKDAIVSIPKSLNEIDNAWTAVPGNAAGIPAGTRIDPNTDEPRETKSLFELITGRKPLGYWF